MNDFTKYFLEKAKFSFFHTVFHEAGVKENWQMAFPCQFLKVQDEKSTSCNDLPVKNHLAFFFFVDLHNYS